MGLVPAPHVHLLTPEPRPTSDVMFHHDRAPGQKYLIIDAGRISSTPMYVALRRVDNVPQQQPRWLDPHQHWCDSYYIFLGDRIDMSGLAAIAELETKEFEIEAPALVWIPPFCTHHYWLRKGSGWFLQVTLSPDYDGSLVLDDQIHAPPNIESASVSQRLKPNTVVESAGLLVEIVELAGGDSRNEQPSVACDVAVSRYASPAQLTVALEDGELDVETPIAVYSTGGAPRLAQRTGAPIIVRLALKS